MIDNDQPNAGDQPSLQQRVAELEWYHTLELAPGVITPGWFDLRQIAGQLPMPASLAGRRCLDIGTFDGFWAFEMEKRGAAEVTAVDIIDPAEWDWPVGSDETVKTEIAKRKSAGEGFEVAKAALGSKVTRHLISVYDLDPATLGQFDFVYLGSLLLHLRDPVRALQQVRGICSGSLLVLDAIDLELSLLHPGRPLAELDGLGRPWWWKPTMAGLERMITAGGIEVTEPAKRIFMPVGTHQSTLAFRPQQLLTGRAG